MTDFGPNFKGEALRAASFQMLGLGLNDFGNITQRSYEGWYWGAWPALCVGLLVRWVAAGVIHVSHRSEQAKKPLSYVLVNDKKAALALVVYLLTLAGLFVLVIYLLERQVSAPGYVKS